MTGITRCWASGKSKHLYAPFVTTDCLMYICLQVCRHSGARTHTHTRTWQFTPSRFHQTAPRHGGRRWLKVSHVCWFHQRKLILHLTNVLISLRKQNQVPRRRSFQPRQARQSMYNVTLRCVRESIVSVQNLYYKLHISVCARARVALHIQHARRMRRITLSSVAPLAPPYFLTLSHKRHGFRGGGGELLNIKWVLIFSTPFIWNISHSNRIHRDIVINVKTSSCKVPVILFVS
jgi:hypothetical protein